MQKFERTTPAPFLSISDNGSLRLKHHMNCPLWSDDCRGLFGELKIVLSALFRGIRRKRRLFASSQSVEKVQPVLGFFI